MKVKLPWVFLMLVLCAAVWLVTRPNSRKHIYDINKNISSHGYLQSDTVKTLVNSDIQCVGSGPDEPEDLLCMESPKYLPNFKNPCWYANENGKFRLRCLPYYHILGVSKSGTTDLSYRIRAHEDVINCNDCQNSKEIFYWCRTKYGYNRRMTEGTLCNFSCYQQKFTTAARKIEQTVTETGYHKLITGDASPLDFSDFRAWPKIPQNADLGTPLVMTPHLMRHVYTDPKFILIFRNPTDRLYSEFMMRKGQSAEDFHEAVSQDIKVEETCMKNHTVEHCMFSLDISRQIWLRLYLGCYSVFMRQWLNVFPRHQFLILRTEDLQEDPRTWQRTVYNYLKLNYTEEWLTSIMRGPHKNASRKKETIGPMLQKTRVLLNGFYSRFNHDLADMLQDKKFLWLT